MKRSLLFFTILIIVASGCKTMEEGTESNNEVRQENKFFYQSIDTRDKSLSNEEIAQITAFANEKASLVCEMESVETKYKENPKLQKESLVRLNQQISALDKKITAYLTNEDRIAAFNEAFSYAYENCRVKV